MVTLAFAQAGNVLVQKNPYGWTGGEEGTGLNYDAVPDAFVGVLNTKNLYWLALGYAVLVFIVVRLAVGSSAGHVWRAVRENEQRVEVIGLSPYPFKLIAFIACRVSRDARRRRLAAPDRRRDARGDDGELHAGAARDGRARRRRDAVRRDDRRLPLHAARPAARLAGGIERRAGAARRPARSRCRSRCSCSARCSSRSSSSCPVGSRACRCGSAGCGRARPPLPEEAAA